MPRAAAFMGKLLAHVVPHLLGVDQDTVHVEDDRTNHRMRRYPRSYDLHDWRQLEAQDRPRAAQRGGSWVIGGVRRGAGSRGTPGRYGGAARLIAEARPG